MEDLLQPQLEQSFRLAMPEGLRDLMCDISREVLRAQPTDLYQFIAKYLEALLLARDTLYNACKLCGEICNCSCQPELDEELRNIGLDGEDLETAKNVVFKHFDNGEVKEASLMTQLLKNTDIDIKLLEDVQRAVRAAFLKHQLRNQVTPLDETEKSSDPAQDAANKTLQIYENAFTDAEYEKENAAVKIQSALRGHLIHAPLEDSARKSKASEAKLTFEGVETPSQTEIGMPVITVDPGTPRASNSKPRYGRLSSTSLAGSFMNLPKHIPYSVHDITYVDFEEHETERRNIYYHHDNDKKKIVFHDKHVLHEIDSYLNEENLEEEIAEEIDSNSSSANESDENIEDIVHNVTYDELNEENQTDSSAFTEQIVKDSVSNVHKKVKEAFKPPNLIEIKSVQKKTKESEEIEDIENKSTGFHDKTIDDDNDDEDRDDESLQRVEGEKKKNKKMYAKADDEMMKTLKKKLIQLSSSDMISSRREK